MKHILGLSGKDSLATALLLKAFEPSVYSELQIFTTLTGADYPETITWLNTVSELLEKEIVFINGNLLEVIESKKKQENYFLPSRQTRYCTADAKIKPLERWLDLSESYTLYVGIRHDESRVGYKSSSSKYNISTEFPLQKYKFDLAKVWALVNGLPSQYQPPTFYWSALHEAARQEWKNQLPMFGSIDDHISEIQKVILFSGRTRPNCYFCFNQRKYEIVWLSETHPGLFEKMKSYESEGKYWLQDFPLKDLSEQKKGEIVCRRAKKIVKMVAEQTFSKQSDGFESMSSCGLFCGK
jgi:hypothetical protein